MPRGDGEPLASWVDDQTLHAMPGDYTPCLRLNRRCYKRLFCLKGRHALQQKKHHILWQLRGAAPSENVERIARPTPANHADDQSHDVRGVGLPSLETSVQLKSQLVRHTVYDSIAGTFIKKRGIRRKLGLTPMASNRQCLPSEKS